MTVFLDADCVITNLIRIKFIKSDDNWKCQHLATRKYFAKFCHILTNGIVEFEVRIENGQHKVSSIYIEILERIYNRNLSAIVNACIII